MKLKKKCNSYNFNRKNKFLLIINRQNKNKEKIFNEIKKMNINKEKSM